MQVDNSTPGNGIAQVQYRLLQPQQTYLNFDEQRVQFIEATLTDSVLGNSKSTHTFQTSDLSFLSALKSAMSGADPELQYRLGFGTAGSIVWLPWQSHFLTQPVYRQESFGDKGGATVVLHTDNNLTRMRRTNRAVAYHGTISSMVARIASSNNMESVVEPTDGEFELVQSFTDDTTFIFDRLVPRAINTQGKGGYFCFIRDNVLHFHTLDYQSTVKTVDYFNTTSLGLTYEDSSQIPALWEEGLAGIAMVLYDPYDGSYATTMSDATKAVRLADSIYNYGNVENAGWDVPYHYSANPKVEAAAIAQNLYQKARLQTFSTQIILTQNVMIRHGDILNVLLPQQAFRSSDYAGLYYATAVTHSVTKSAVTSAITVCRGESPAQRSAIQVQDANNRLVPNSKAPGIPINIPQIQSSELTRGSGNKSSATTYVAVADAQTGLIA